MSEKISGRYVLQTEIGSGGMGAVFRAHDRLTGETVALKRVNLNTEPQLVDSLLPNDTQEQLRLVLAKEFQILAGLRHPNIISVLDYGFDSEQQPFYTMTYLEGSQTILEAGAGLDQNGKLDLIEQLLQGLAYLHRRGILHRDIKPENVLVTNGTVRLLDFGLSQTTEEEGAIGGSPLYMAPELIEGEEPTAAADLYAVGVLLFQLLTGEHPFGQFDTGFFKRLLTVKPDCAAIDPRLHPLLLRLLAHKPHERLSSALEVSKNLAAALERPLSPETAAVRESYLQAAQFVGRERELSQLTTALEEARNGQGSAWLIGGESGVGKSRLINELRTYALVSGFQVWRGQASAGDGTPLQLWRNLVGHLALNTDLSDLEASFLKEIAPDLPQILQRPIPDPVEIDGQARLQRIAITLARLLRRQSQPILLLLEDLHLANESLEPLLELLPSLERQALLIVGTYRHDEQPDLPDLLEDGVHTLVLPRFDEPDVARLVAAMLGEVGRQREIVDQLTKETEGNIFFLVEILRAWSEEAGGLAQLGEASLPQHLLTGGILQIITRRLSKVAAAYLPLLKLAAIAGRELDLVLLTRLVPKTNIDAWLLACSEAMVLEIEENSWRFAHDKLREVLRQEMTADEWKQGHKAVALAIEAVYPGRDENAVALMTHWREAGHVDKEIRYAVSACTQLTWSGRFDEAEQRIHRLLNFYAEKIPERVKLELLKTLGNALRELDLYPESVAYWREGLALARSVGDSEAEMEQLIGLGWSLWRQVQYDQSYMGNQPHIIERLKEAQAHLLEAEELARALGNLSGLGHSVHNQGLVVYFLDNDIERCTQLLYQSLALFEQSDDLSGMVMARADLTNALMGQKGAKMKAKEHALAGLSLTKRIGNPTFTPFLLTNLILIAISEADWPEIDTYIPELSLFGNRPSSYFYPHVIYYQAVNAFVRAEYSLVLTICGKSVDYILPQRTFFREIWLLYGSAALMLGKEVELGQSLGKLSAALPDNLSNLDWQGLWLLYAEKSLLDGKLKRGAAWLGLSQVIDTSALQEENSSIYQLIVKRIATKFRASLVEHDVTKILMRGTPQQVEEIQSRWPANGVQDKAELEAVLGMVDPVTTV